MFRCADGEKERKAQREQPTIFQGGEVCFCSAASPRCIGQASLCDDANPAFPGFYHTEHRMRRKRHALGTATNGSWGWAVTVKGPVPSQHLAADRWLLNNRGRSCGQSVTLNPRYFTSRVWPVVLTFVSWWGLCHHV